jgi:hypothetical protein
MKLLWTLSWKSIWQWGHFMDDSRVNGAYRSCRKLPLSNASGIEQESGVNKEP